MLNSVSKNLKSFFIFSASTIILIFAILIFVFFRNNKNQNADILVIKELKETSENFKQLYTALETYKNTNHSDNFFIYKHDTYSDKIYFYLNLLKEKVNNLKKISAGNFDITEKFNEINDFLTDFESDFELLNENILKLGNSLNGYTENIIRTEQKTDKILKSYPQLYNSFQNLKKAKNDLLSFGNKQNEEQFFTEKKVFLRELKLNQSVFENTSEKQIVLNNTADWINTVIQFHKLQKINGTAYYSGIYNDLKDLIQNSENNLNSIQDIVLAEINNTNRKFLINFVLLLIIFTVAIILTVFSIYNFLKKQLKIVNNELSELAVSDKIENSSEFRRTKYLIQELKNNTKNNIKFIEQLKSGNLSKINPDINPNDKLGNALIDLKTFLKEKDEENAKKEEIQAISDRQKEGIVKFGRIIRRHIGSLDDMTFNVLSELVHFLNADIGGIYIIDKKEDTEILKLKASYAYDEKKLIKKEIQIGEGLVGTCAADKSSVYIDRVDDDYIKIVSGFGHSKPNCLLLSPIFIENKVYGVIELASSGTFSKYDIKFVETLSEDIAYTLSYMLK